MNSLFSQGVDVTKRMDDSVHKLFLDPTARHLIVCMESQESFYLARNSKKSKPLSKMRVSSEVFSDDGLVGVDLSICLKYHLGLKLKTHTSLDSD